MFLFLAILKNKPEITSRTVISSPLKYGLQTLVELGSKIVTNPQNMSNRRRILDERDEMKINKKMKVASEGNPSPAPVTSSHWSMGLVREMSNPDSIVKKTDRTVVIKDKFPKAKLHFLVLPYQDLANIHKLDSSHIDLLKEFGKLFEEIKAEHKDVKLRAGFHAVPSMYKLHMHIISTDMISPCLKTKIHWNSFTTNYFMPYEDVLKELEDNGSIKKMSSEECKSALNSPLACNQCSHIPKNIPQLKLHLLTHEKNTVD